MPDAQGSESQQTEKPAEGPKYVTLDDVTKIVNSAITSHNKRQESSIAKLLDERLSAFAKPKVEEQGGEAGNDPKAPKVDPELLKLRRDFEAQQKVLAEEKSKRETAERKQREERAISQLQSSFSGKVRQEAIPVLVKAFRADISFDEETGEPMLPVDGGIAAIPAAVDSWLKSKDSEAFRPAPNAGGSGGQRNKSGGQGPTKPYAQMSSEEKLDAFDRLDRQLNQQQ